MTPGRAGEGSVPWTRAWNLLGDSNPIGGRVAAMPESARELARAAKGFSSDTEGLTLFQLAAEVSARAPCLELGSYCGKTTLFLAAGCRLAGQNPVYAVDHHRGSAEQQPGQEYFDPELLDARGRGIDTFPHFRRTLEGADLIDWVVPIVASSALARRFWSGSRLSLVFIDGDHAEAAVRADVNAWSSLVIPGGYLCLHDVFSDPREGGQAPYFVFREVVRSGGWQDMGRVESLGVLRKKP